VSALSSIFKELPEDFPGAILIVMHVSATARQGWLSERLSTLGHIPVKTAEEGEEIRQGMAYTAPGDKHLLVKDHRITLGTGPREQFVRPSIDALFRSAASAFGPRAIGVILTGQLSDGTMGLRAIRDAGGITIVQDPMEAEHRDMPQNAMEGLGVDYCLKLSEIGPLLDLLVRRAGSSKQGVLETGLASSVRLMKDRAQLLAKLYAQSRDNPKTERFLAAEIMALDQDISDVKRLLEPAKRAAPK
jgi:two-component system chemotaxis response regulator CheB